MKSGARPSYTNEATAGSLCHGSQNCMVFFRKRLYESRTQMSELVKHAIDEEDTNYTQVVSFNLTAMRGV